MVLPNFCFSIAHIWHFIVSCARPQNFDFFSFRISDYLSSNVGLIPFIENIYSIVNCQISEVYFFFRTKSKLLNFESFLPCKSWNSSHYFINISVLTIMVIRSSHIICNFLNIFHGPCSIIRRNWSWLSYWMNMSHVINGLWRAWVHWFDVSIHVFNSNELRNLTWEVELE